MSEKPRTVVHEINDDLDAETMILIGKHNCRNTFEMNARCIGRCKKRLIELGLAASYAVIVLVNVNDVHGGQIADALIPGMNWQEIRDRGETPFARGLAIREGIQKTLDTFDQEAATTLRGMTGVVAVVVDHGVAEVFQA